MNRPDVLAAIHANTHYTRPWPSHPPGWQYGSELADINLIYPEFFSKAPQWKITIVSGDADAAGIYKNTNALLKRVVVYFMLFVLPFMGTQRWIECLGRPVVVDWTNWWMDQDVAGSYKIYDGITFQTVKGCGHTIPTYCPEQGFLFFEQYINGTYSSQTERKYCALIKKKNESSAKLILMSRSKQESLTIAEVPTHFLFFALLFELPKNSCYIILLI
ncbi:hypothetical protein RFI_12965 [Reticulomyxa filosa]|uniref:Serine carboxypeptidase n=1 Tax=Reticulomyxa filosa TaxID=46433 RepID=X6NFS4_RETFI|nr:hypothetical protein RFI_12965 [Reticulomyxa filosa]|eukprot:ETO24192.1 hypothetical protein RFI_12965 [Reticulomyxa filosa]